MKRYIIFHIKYLRPAITSWYDTKHESCVRVFQNF
jgi:hypothetical protein